MAARRAFGVGLRDLAAVLLSAASSLALLLCPAAPSLAQSYPSRPVKVIVPFPPGGSFDAVARIVMQHVSDSRGWTYAIENRSGADGQIGVIAAARADPDGYTLLAMTSITHGSAPALKPSLGYDPVADIAPIVLLGEAPLVLLVKKEVPAASLKELLALMRAEPGKLNYGAGGASSQHYMATALLLSRAGLPQTAAVHVPFQGIAPAVLALMAGTVDFMFGSTGNASQSIASGSIRALAVTSNVRSPRLPSVPTMAEAGVPGVEIAPWVGLGAPAHTPRAIVDKWAEAANQALSDPSVRERIAAVDYKPRGGSPEDLARFSAADIARYRKLVAELRK